MGKSSSEQHFRKSTAITPLLCEISGALHLAQPGLMAGWLAVRPSVQLADEIQVNFEIFKVGCRSKYSTCHFVNQGTASLQPYQCILADFFWVKPIARLIFKA